MKTVQAYSDWKVGQKCQVQEWSGIHEIDRIHVYSETFVQAHVYKLRKDGTRTRYNGTVTMDKLMKLDAKQPTTDKNGLTAEQYARKAFKAGIVMHDLCRTTCQSLMKVLSISKTGRVKVQPLVITKGTKYVSQKVGDQVIRSQEVQTINWMNLEYEPYADPQTYTPRLHDGQWTFWHGEGYIKPAGMKLEQLLD